VIEAVKSPRVSGSLATHLGTPMSTGIKEHSNVVVLVSTKNYRAAADVPGLKISNIRNFRGVPAINPTSIKNFYSLFIKDRWVRESSTIEPKNQIFWIINYKRLLFTHYNIVSLARGLICPPRFQYFKKITPRISNKKSFLVKISFH
jgi:hypothetical protein